MLKIFAPAKINLHLHITGKRVDGYHLLDSLVCFADTGDTLIFEPRAHFDFKIEGPFADCLNAQDRDLSRNSGNTVVRAAYLLADSLKKDLHVAITLVKNLPPASGIGGGSADAAACLWGLCQFWNLTLPDENLQALGQKIGSDVPACLKSVPTIMRGTGDLCSKAPDLPEIPALLVWPDRPATTQEVYRNFKVENFSEIADFKPSYDDVKTLALDLALRTRNDLDAPAQTLVPTIGDALAALKNQPGCFFQRMSGSGSTVFGFFEIERQSAAAAETISSAYPNWWARPCWLNRTARY